jgi:hypothetical protein
MEERLREVFGIGGSLEGDPLGGGPSEGGPLGGGSVGKKALGEDFVLIKRLEKSLAMTEQRLGEREMRNEMGSWCQGHSAPNTMCLLAISDGLNVGYHTWV